MTILQKKNESIDNGKWPIGTAVVVGDSLVNDTAEKMLWTRTFR